MILIIIVAAAVAVTNALKYADDDWRNDAQGVDAELNSRHNNDAASSIDNDIDCKPPFFFFFFANFHFSQMFENKLTFCVFFSL